MNERIRQFLLTENKSSAQFAEEIGVQPSGISHILSGRNKPSLDFVLKMLEKYRNISVEWLLFGTGQMYRDGSIMNLFDNAGAKGEDGADKEHDADNDGVVAVTVRNEQGTTEGITPKDLQTPVRSGVKKIVWFYGNNSFEEYYPAGDG
ncbi:MAG TPA: helix-turn-helix transcriptional regulator [Bacteroidales bacterium]|nr:helix-turn-helix transcriptional regulator [Bacteroidales bacterium]